MTDTRSRRLALQQTAQVLAEDVEAYLAERPERYVLTLMRLTHVSALAEVAQAQLAEDVAVARRNGATWEAIGQTLGVSKQAAQQRYGRGPMDTDDRGPTLPVRRPNEGGDTTTP